MNEDRSFTQWFGENLAELIGNKIKNVYSEFNVNTYRSIIHDKCDGLSYTKRVELHCEVLRLLLPDSYKAAIEILLQILGDENPFETGMFANYYWILPIGKFVEKYGLDDFDISMQAIEEITKRNTGEYAIRPFIRKYPEQTISKMTVWSKSDNFHLRRLATEGTRPKLPWAKKLDLFIDNPKPIFNILDNLIDDEIKFVQKSVANNITDYLKLNKPAAISFINKHSNSTNKNTQWILKYATRKIKI